MKILAIDSDEVAESAAPFAIIESQPPPPLPPPGTWTWKAGEYGGATALSGSYRLRVRSMADASICDDSAAAFELKSLHAMVGKAQRMPIQREVALNADIQNYPCRDTFPGDMTAYVPSVVFQQGRQQLFCGSCGNPNQYAQAGVYWFPYENYNVAAICRSRILFHVGEFPGQGANLQNAKLKMKRVHSIHEDAGSGCGCQENIWVLNAAMTNYQIPAVGQRIDVDLNANEFTLDVTAIVRQWLDGTLANNGLLLLVGELSCSGGRKCASCYEPTLVLEMQ